MKIRISVLLIGLLIGLVAVNPMPASAGHATAANWEEYAQVAGAAARAEAQLWIQEARMNRSKCTVHGPIATGSRGVFSSNHSFTGRVRDALLGAGAPNDVAEGWDAAFEDAWNAWAGGVRIPGLPWYPSLAVWLGAFAPPTPNVPWSFGALPSTGTQEMSSQALVDQISGNLGSAVDEPAASAAIDAFADYVSDNFSQMRNTSTVVLVNGSGPVPSFHPPFIVVGPVLGGSCAGIGVVSLSGQFWPLPLRDISDTEPDEPVVINDSLSVSALATSYDSKPAPNAPAGVFTIAATFTNHSSSNLFHLFFDIAVMSGRNLVLNCDGGPAGVGCDVPVPHASLGPDGELSPGESFMIEFEVGLASASPFDFLIDAFGVVEQNP